MVALHVDVQLHHLIEGIPAGGRVKHHRQGFPPATQAHPIEVVDGLAGFDALHQEIQATPGGAQGAIHHQAPRSLGKGSQ